MHFGFYGDNLNGKEVQGTIDTQVAPAFQANLPTIHVGPAHCPSRLDVSQGRTEHCTLPVGNIDLPIAVTGEKGSPRYFTTPEGTVVAPRQLETQIEHNVTAYFGGNPHADCGTKELRVMYPGDHLRCRLSGVRADHVDLTISAQKEIKLGRPSGMGPSRFDLLFGPVLEAHRAHREALVSGTAAAWLLRTRVTDSPLAQPASAWMLHDVRCPATLDLTGSRRGTCLAMFPFGSVPYELWIDGKVVGTDPTNAVIQTRKVHDLAVVALRSRLDAVGLNDPVAVDCGPDRTMVLAPKSTLYCRIITNRSTMRMKVTVLDASGRFWMNVEKKKDGS